jgi:hypothetical protein
VLVQAFQPAVTTDGEYSAVFVAGRLSHVARKCPQKATSGCTAATAPPASWAGIQPWMAAYCRRVLAAAPSMPLYARVDFLLPRPAEPVLMELELLEPDLYLRECPGAAARLAAALAARARQLPKPVPGDRLAGIYS